MRRLFKRALSEESLPQKNGKYKGLIVGDDDGEWMFGGISDISNWDWYFGFGVFGKKKKVSVENATEHNRGFVKALKGVVKKYPEFLEFDLDFDGNVVAVTDLVGKGKRKSGKWKRITFFHGTSSGVVDKILHSGLRPRDLSGQASVYGRASGARSGRKDSVYLTTQLGMAQFAASEAAVLKGGDPVILRVRGLDGDFLPDEDSGERDAYDSLSRMGSVAFRGVIKPKNIDVYMVRDDKRWKRV